MIRTLFALGLSLSACTGNETVAAYGGSGVIWTLREIDGLSFNATATLGFPEPGRIAGDAPCNAYSAEMTAPYPWFEAGPIAATRRACPDLDAETRFLAALAEMTQSEVLDETLILSNEAGRQMVFKASG